MKRIEDLKIRIFSDGAGIEDFKTLAKVPYVKGFTTNPSLMKKAGVVDYEKFIHEVLGIVNGKPISFEVVCDEFDDMKKQALKLAGYGENVYVKIPIVNTKNELATGLIDELSHNNVNVNVTAVLTLRQVEAAAKVLTGGARAIISVFAGRIADTGIDPAPVMVKARRILENLDNVELLWASTREMLNIFQAQESGCDIITVPPEILKKASLIGYDLDRLSHDTVKTFCSDAACSGLRL